MMSSNFAFFGSADFSVYILDEMGRAGFTPSLVVTTPDKPKGRKLVLTPTPVKVWADARGVAVLSPEKLDAAFIELYNDAIKSKGIAVAVVAAYGKIIPETILGLPPRETLNVHPSLLPIYRGASPIHSAMIDDAKETGVTIIVLDKLMDHGPIIAQKKVTIDEWPTYEGMEKKLAKVGADLLVSILPEWISDSTDVKKNVHDQDHSRATFTKKITKEDGLIDINDALTGSSEKQYEIFRKIQAYHVWPSVYFFMEDKKSSSKIRVKITEASWQDGKLSIKKVIPEGKSEMDFESFRIAYKIS